MWKERIFVPTQKEKKTVLKITKKYMNIFGIQEFGVEIRFKT